MIYLLYLFCFLIISCDLPSEANQDCNGDNGGIATLDDCGRCAGGNTNIVPNQDKDCDNKCFGDSYIDDCGVCDDIEPVVIVMIVQLSYLMKLVPYVTVMVI
jgi:hypothetical protein